MKQYPRMAKSIFREPWLITPAMHDSIRAQFISHLSNLSALDTLDSEPASVPQAENIAIIPVFGILGKHLSSLETACGGLDVDDIAQQLKAARDDTNTKAIVLFINSPGGTVTGIPETAELIASVAQVKPVYGFTDADTCSAAYWLASQCTAFYCTGSANVGSVGVYMCLLDESKALEKEGVTVNAISAGEHKLMGASFKALTDSERKMFQADVDKIYTQFVSAISSKRTIDTQHMQGQVFDGEQAVNNGFADGLVSDIDELLSLLRVTGDA